jgi:hypothetical protein
VSDLFDVIELMVDIPEHNLRVPVPERIAALMADMPEETAQEILDFARFLYARKQQALSIGSHSS